ncbi:hypothetical protein QR680_019152 [Steinernema hermaphroditum]|uniref:Uncharacterized protein n=1 Tax=Steinernema hermaphroditum TaxID=289476 RepID=A0AA39HL40_9BILA|nr:hypothetical protein QR680_019152 [Steinernema hermaphroditum]
MTSRSSENWTDYRLTSRDSDFGSTTIPSRMPSYSNSHVLCEEMELSSDNQSDRTSVCNREALQKYLDELHSEMSEHNTVDLSEVEENRSEYFFDELNAPEVAPKSTAHSEYVMDFRGNDDTNQ